MQRLDLYDSQMQILFGRDSQETYTSGNMLPREMPVIQVSGAQNNKIHAANQLSPINSYFIIRLFSWLGTGSSVANQQSSKLLGQQFLSLT